MALKAWYTFNNNYNNQGCGDAALTQTVAPTYVDGKIGKALNQGGFKLTAAQTAKILNNKAISICFWVYIDLDEGSTSNRAMFFGNDSMNSLGGRQFSLFNYPTSNDLHWSWQNYTGGAYSMVTSGVLNNVIPARTWTHIAVTYENPNGIIYINGVQKQTFSGVYNADSFAFDTQIIYNNAYHRFNDYRIYDECLSQKKIKEISKGLVAHYKLEGPGANPNLLKNTNTNSGDNNYWLSYSTFDETTRTLTRSTTATTESYITHIISGLKTNHTYTLSFYAKSNGYVSSMEIFCYNANVQGVKRKQILSSLLSNTYQRFTWTFTTDSNVDYSTNAQIRFDNNGSTQSGTEAILYIKEVKLEEGDKVTPWIPNTQDSLYNVLGYNNIISRDSSGNGYHLTENGTQTYNLDSARYSGSTKMGGTNVDYLRGPILDFLKSPFTFNCWIYQTSATSTSSGNTGNTLQFIMGQGRDCGYAGFALCSANGYARLYLGSATSGTYWGITDNTVSLLNGWHMLTGTFDGTNAKLYVDGELKKTQASSVDPVWTDTGGFVIGKMSFNYTNNGAYFPFVGSVSDAKVYATALSADEILTIYKNSGIIDNKGNVYAYEFKEE